jgi:hypothetical protein
MNDQRSKLANLFPLRPHCPRNYQYTSISELYDKFRRELQDKTFLDPLGRDNFFRERSFPHLIKLEYFDRKQSRRVDAVARHAMEQLRSGTLDESRYRIGDRSRPRSLFWSPEIITTPDDIHPNKRNRNGEVYAKRYLRTGGGSSLKLVLVETDKVGDRAIFTTFWSEEEYHARCIGHPARYRK